jgi:hypothetical protein
MTIIKRPALAVTLSASQVHADQVERRIFEADTRIAVRALSRKVTAVEEIVAMVPSSYDDERSQRTYTSACVRQALEDVVNLLPDDVAVLVGRILRGDETVYGRDYWRQTAGSPPEMVLAPLEVTHG